MTPVKIVSILLWKMKELYFTKETIFSKSQEMLCKIKDYNYGNKFKFNLGCSALIILDMQKYFFSKYSHAFIPSAPAIVPGIKKLINEYELRNLPIIFTRHINNFQNAKLMAKWWKDLIKEENPLSEIIDGLNVSCRTVFKKSQYDAFYDTLLEELLKKEGVNQIVICGVMTHLCCETTARSAFMRGFEVFFTIDGTATYNEKFHLATLLNLSHGFSELVFIKDILNLMKKK